MSPAEFEKKPLVAEEPDACGSSGKSFHGNHMFLGIFQVFKNFLLFLEKEKEGKKEERKEGRQEGRKEGRKECTCWVCL